MKLMVAKTRHILYSSHLGWISLAKRLSNQLNKSIAQKECESETDRRVITANISFLTFYKGRIKSTIPYITIGDRREPSFNEHSLEIKETNSISHFYSPNKELKYWYWSFFSIYCLYNPINNCIYGDIVTTFVLYISYHYHYFIYFYIQKHHLLRKFSFNNTSRYWSEKKMIVFNK